ncbi:MAG: 3'-5' exonuclease [Bacteroidota bacterium]
MSWFKGLFGKDDRPIPDYWNHYLELFKTKTPSNTAIKDLRFVVLDTETTGFDKDKKILSIGAIALQGGRIAMQDSFEALLHQVDMANNAEAISVHGITPTASSNGQVIETVLEDWVEYIGNAILVAHNAQYDIGMLNGMIQTQFDGKLKNKVLDTADLAIRLEKYGEDPSTIKRSEYTLDELCNRYNIEVHDRHTAAGDAFLTAKLLLLLLTKAEKRGIKTYGELRLK